MHARHVSTRVLFTEDTWNTECRLEVGELEGGGRGGLILFILTCLVNFANYCYLLPLMMRWICLAEF